jgi:hypothetical protein
MSMCCSVSPEKHKVCKSSIEHAAYLKVSHWFATYRFDPSILNERNMVRSKQPRFSYNLAQGKEQHE